MIFLRSTIFNILFYGLTALACVLCLPGLFLSREKALYIVYAYVQTLHWLEKNILGLDYEVRGLQNVPKDGAFIVAAKHQSPYETFKLHILFKDPAIILKRELLDIPLWGRFLAKIDPIAINRKNAREAILQINRGAQRVKDQGRPVIIFPQGTRVYPWETVQDKPYKPGIGRVYAETSLPIVPLALNTGLFWPRTSWVKQPGKVIFEFLPPILPGKDYKAAVADLEARLEAASQNLQDETLARYPELPRPMRPAEESAS